MKMKLTLTSTRRLFKKNFTLTYDWNEVIRVYDITKKEELYVKVSRISLYDHQPVIDGVRYRIIHAYSFQT